MAGCEILTDESGSLLDVNIESCETVIDTMVQYDVYYETH